MTRRSLFLAALVGFSSPIGAQAVLSISGSVIAPNGLPIPYSTISIAETGAARFTDEAGQFIMAGLQPGSYHLRVKQLGFTALDTVITLTPGTSRRVQITLSPTAFRLSTVTVKAPRGCTTVDEAAGKTNFATVLDELRNNAERERILVKSYPFVYNIARSIQVPSPTGNLMTRLDTTSFRSDTRPPYEPGKIVRIDPSAPPPDAVQMIIPVLEDIGDPEFLRSHCFRYAGITSDVSATTHRIDFEPVRSLKKPDIEGSFFLDTASFVVRRAAFRLTRANQVDQALQELQVTTNYREVFPGVTVIGDVTSVLARAPGPALGARTIRLTEKQRLINYQFLGTRPGGPPSH